MLHLCQYTEHTIINQNTGHNTSNQHTELNTTDQNIEQLHLVVVDLWLRMLGSAAEECEAKQWYDGWVCCRVDSVQATFLLCPVKVLMVKALTE